MYNFFLNYYHAQRSVIFGLYVIRRIVNIYLVIKLVYLLVDITYCSYYLSGARFYISEARALRIAQKSVKNFP